MTQPDLFTAPIRDMAPASVEAWDRITPTLSEREIVIFLLVHRYLEQTGHVDVTGGELAEFAGMQRTSTRPRLTGLADKGWILAGPMRKSRLFDECVSHGYRPNLPREAIERVKRKMAMTND